jgi:hypothetical protein
MLPEKGYDAASYP